MATPFSYANLLAILNNSKTKRVDPALYETIKQLLQNLDTNQQNLQSQITVNTNGLDQEILTADNATGVLPNSRELVAGTNITLDKSQGGKEIINASGGGGSGQGGTGAIFLRENEQDEPLTIPGPQGNIGPTGPAGPQGIAGSGVAFFPTDGEDGQDSYIPGPQGLVGNSDWQLIATNTPSGTGTTSFTSLGAFTHLKIIFSARSDGSAISTTINIQLNSDTGANYDIERLQVQGTATPAAAETLAGTSAQIAQVTAATGVANACGAGEILFVDYRGTTFNKSGTSVTMYRFDTVSAATRLNNYAWSWRNNAAITRIDLILQLGNYVSGSKFSLYGMK